MANNNQRLERYVSKHLATLPSESLRDLLWTDSQRDWFDEQRFHYDVVSDCWKARLNGEDDPIITFLRQGKIDRLHYDYTWRQVDWYQALWAMVQLGEGRFRSEAKRLRTDYPFGCARELFLEIVRAHADNTVKVSMLPYAEVSVPKNGLAASYAVDVLAKKEAGPIAEGKLRQIKSNNAAIPKNFWLGFALATCTSGRISKVLEDKFDDLSKATARLAETREQMAKRTRGSKTFKRPRSHVWRNGQIVYSEQGSYPT